MGKRFFGVAPTGIPKHIIKVNNKHVGVDEDFASVKAYGPAVFINNRQVALATSNEVLVLLPRGMRLKGLRASHGAWLRVGYYG